MRQALWDRYIRSDTGTCDAERMAMDIERLGNALRDVVQSHCPNDRMFCGDCTPARKLLDELGLPGTGAVRSPENAPSREDGAAPVSPDRPERPERATPPWHASHQRT